MADLGFAARRPAGTAVICIIPARVLANILAVYNTEIRFIAIITTVLLAHPIHTNPTICTIRAWTRRRRTTEVVVRLGIDTLNRIGCHTATDIHITARASVLTRSRCTSVRGRIRNRML